MSRNKIGKKLHPKVPWERKGLFYYAIMKLYLPDNGTVIITKRLNFMAYHLIKFIHGEAKLSDMAITATFEEIPYHGRSL